VTQGEPVQQVRLAVTDQAGRFALELPTQPALSPSRHAHRPSSPLPLVLRQLLLGWSGARGAPKLVPPRAPLTACDFPALKPDMPL
jgi:hypothetical protein